MLNYNQFSILILISIIAPIIGACVLLLTLVFEREIDLLKSQNSKLALEKELHQMEYLQLNQQIQPHFLFNTLNLLLILARLNKSGELITAMEHLSLFLRSRYQNKKTWAVISEEVAITLSYLEIQKLRFGQRLKINLDVQEGLDDIRILPYLLQTLVENAFKHGLEKKAGDAVLTIELSFAAQWIRLMVRDNGPGLDGEKSLAAPLLGEGEGLRNIRRRFKILYGDLASLELRRVGDETEVAVSWPFNTPQKVGVGV